MSVADPDRRQFSRVPFDSWVEIHQDEHYWNAALLDISLHGFLIKKPEKWQLDTNRGLLATVRFSHDCSILVRARWAHADQFRVGFKNTGMDLESMTRLRRVIESNLGNYNTVMRELAALPA